MAAQDEKCGLKESWSFFELARYRAQENLGSFQVGVATLQPHLDAPASSFAKDGLDAVARLPRLEANAPSRELELTGMLHLKDALGIIAGSGRGQVQNHRCIPNPDSQDPTTFDSVPTSTALT